MKKRKEPDETIIHDETIVNDDMKKIKKLY